MKKRLLAMLLCLTMVTGMAAGCSSQKNESAAPDTTAAETAGETAVPETEPQVDNASAVPEKLEEIAAATADEVTAFMEDSDEKTVLLDARAQEAYAGWSIDGAANGGFPSATIHSVFPFLTISLILQMYWGRQLPLVRLWASCVNSVPLAAIL